MSRQRPSELRQEKTFGYLDRASVASLAHHNSPIGRALSLLPDWMLREADRSAQWQYDYQAEHKKPFLSDYLPLPDPYSYLLSAPAVSPKLKRVLRAAQSWLFGLRHLLRMAEGFATLTSDLYQAVADARAREDSHREARALTKLQRKFILSPLVRAEVRAQHDPKLSAEVAVLLKRRQAQISHRAHSQRDKGQPLDPILLAGALEKRFPIESYLVEAWPCFPNGPWPGLMYWHNDAITKYLAALGLFNVRRYRELGREHIKKVRQRLGLLPANDRWPLVWDVTITRVSLTDFSVTCHARNRDKLFKGECRKIPPPRTSS